jgi:hypothetical protein
MVMVRREGRKGREEVMTCMNDAQQMRLSSFFARDV